MALPPKFAGQKLTFGPAPTVTAAGVPAAVHTLEVFVDFACPYSAKIFKTLYTVVAPAIRANPAWASSVEVIFRQQVQPWHPSSTLMHEAAVAVLQLDPAKFWPFAEQLFLQQKDFFDVNVVNETRNATYARIAKNVAAKVGVDEKALLDKLTIPDKPAADGSLNVGNAVTNDLKVLVKMARLTGVHVSPTVIFDGVVQNDISSGWTGDQWNEWLTKNIV